MVDFIREQLDELMGRGRDLPQDAKLKQRSWRDSENCKFFMVKKYFIFFYFIDFLHKFNSFSIHSVLTISLLTLNRI